MAGVEVTDRGVGGVEEDIATGDGRGEGVEAGGAGGALVRDEVETLIEGVGEIPGSGAVGVGVDPLLEAAVAEGAVGGGLLAVAGVGYVEDGG